MASSMDWEGVLSKTAHLGVAGLSTGVWPLAVAGLVAGFVYGLATEGDPELANLMNQRNQLMEKWMNEGLGLSRQEVQKYMGLTRTPETGQTARALMTTAEGAPWQAAQTQAAMKDAQARGRKSISAAHQAIAQHSDQQAQYKKQMINQLSQQIAAREGKDDAANAARMARALDPSTIAKAANVVGKVETARDMPKSGVEDLTDAQAKAARTKAIWGAVGGTGDQQRTPLYNADGTIQGYL